MPQTKGKAGTRHLRWGSCIGTPRVSTTMSPLKEEVFYYQFGSQNQVTTRYYWRKTSLYYQLKLSEGPIIAKDYLQNKKKHHAEICFIHKIKSLQLDQSQQLEITCCVTWSPCPSCAWKLVAFVKDGPYLSLQNFVSHLYFHWRWKYQQELKHRQTSRIPVAVMSCLEFEDCWGKFVDAQDRPIQPWDNLEYYSKSTELMAQEDPDAPEWFREWLWKFETWMTINTPPTSTPSHSHPSLGSDSRGLFLEHLDAS